MPKVLPRGAVTFVFTDIEGSTRMLRRMGDAYADVLERHRNVLREAWAASDGVEVNTEGDACFVAFGSADRALAGCVAAQRALARTSWPEGGAPRVRMGVHTGIAFPHDGDYVALAVHQAARVVHAAHGGQIVASEQTVGALRAAVRPVDVEVSDLGRYRLRDFDGPVSLFQIGGQHGGHSGDFPSVRAVPADHHNIVPARTLFVGREKEIVGIVARLERGRAVSVVGTGGVGKTRLAMEVGLRVAPEWPDGVWIVDLSSVGIGQPVVPAVAGALGASASGPDGRQDLLDHLNGLDALLILDSCERVVEQCAELVREVLDHCPSIAVLSTSREPLGLAEEHVHRLAPLPVGDDAVALFLDRVGNGAAADGERDIIARICERLDGMPLAIELAAARRGVLSLTEILDGLNERFRLLRSRDRTAPERQRTMTGLLDWSYDLLPASERVAFERLSIFPASFDLAAATAAVAHDGLDPYDVPELVWSLADKSLLVVEPAANATRYRMFETVRAYAAGHLHASAETVATTAALAAWYVDQFPLADRGQRGWLSALASEVDTITALIELLERDDPSLPALARIRAELRSVTGEPRLGWEEIDDVLGRLTTPTPSTARLVLTAASLLADSGHLDRAMQRCDEGESLLDQVGDTDQWGAVRATSPRALVLLRAGRPDDLIEAEAIANAAAVAAGSDVERADALLRLALVKSALGSEGVAEALDEAAQLARHNRDHVLVALALNNLVEEELRQGLTAQAAAHQREALAYAAELGMEHLTTFGLITAARIAEANGSDAVAIRLHALAERRLAETGLQLFPDDQASSDAMLARAVSRLGETAFAEARRSAAPMATEEALEEADSVLASASGATGPPHDL